jgi:hypothetical protein
LNLLLVDSQKTVIPSAQQRELTLALMELLIGAAEVSNPQLEDGGEDELEAHL